MLDDIRYALRQFWEEPRIRRCRRRHARARHRGGLGHVRPDSGRPALAAALRRPGSARAGVVRPRRPAVQGLADGGEAQPSAATIEAPACIAGRSTSSSSRTAASRWAGWRHPELFQDSRSQTHARPRIHRGGGQRPKVPPTGIILGYELWRRSSIAIRTSSARRSTSAGPRAAAGCRHHAAGHALPARSRRGERTELRRQRPRRLLAPDRARRNPARSRGVETVSRLRDGARSNRRRPRRRGATPSRGTKPGEGLTVNVPPCARC